MSFPWLTNHQPFITFNQPEQIIPMIVVMRREKVHRIKSQPFSCCVLINQWQQPRSLVEIWLKWRLFVIGETKIFLRETTTPKLGTPWIFRSHDHDHNFPCNYCWTSSWSGPQRHVYMGPQLGSPHWSNRRQLPSLVNFLCAPVLM